MKLLKKQTDGLNIALNEATLLEIKLSSDKKKMAMTFDVLSLPSQDKVKLIDQKIFLILYNIGRIAISLKKGNWDDKNAKIIKLSIDNFAEVLKKNCGYPIYGNDFFNCEKNDFVTWKERLSLNIVNEDGSVKNTLDIFQEGKNHLDMRIWFEGLKILSLHQNEISIEDFIAGGKRWWGAFYKKDKRTQEHGIILRD